MHEKIGPGCCLVRELRLELGFHITDSPAYRPHNLAQIDGRLTESKRYSAHRQLGTFRDLCHREAIYLYRAAGKKGIHVPFPIGGDYYPGKPSPGGPCPSKNSLHFVVQVLY